MLSLRRAYWIATLVVFLLALDSLWLFLRFEQQEPFILHKELVQCEQTPTKIAFHLGQGQSLPIFTFPHVKEELSFSTEPPCPGSLLPSTLKLKLRESEQERRMLFMDSPLRIDLQYGDGGRLEFASEPSLFWAEITQASPLEVNVVVFVRSGQEERHESFLSLCSESFSSCLPEESPLKEIAASRYLGQNLFEKVYHGSSLFLIELGGQRIALRPNDLLVFQGGRWLVISGEKELEYAARIRRAFPSELEWEGWDKGRYYRFLLPLIGERGSISEGDLFANVRVRSSQQISCALDKQGLILKAGDWALKQNGLWKVLRKAVDREAFIEGRIKGDLFVFDRIEERANGSFLVGHLFRGSCTQMQRVEVAILQRKRNAKKSRGDKVDLPTQRGERPFQ